LGKSIVKEEERKTMKKIRRRGGGDQMKEESNINDGADLIALDLREGLVQTSMEHSVLGDSLLDVYAIDLQRSFSVLSGDVRVGAVTEDGA
jgi:hypothetical protein